MTHADRRGLGIAIVREDNEWIGTEQGAKDFGKGMQDISGEFARSLGADTPRLSLDDARAQERWAAKENKNKSKKARRCCDCRDMLMQQHYSTNQWTKPAPRCIKCCAATK